MSDCGDPDYHQYPDAHPISVRFMSSKPISFQPRSRQDTLQSSPPSGPEAVLSLRISGRSTPSDPTSDDDNGPRHHYVLDGIIPIDVEIRVTTSSTDPHELTFSVTTPVTPGPVVLSRPISPFTSALLFPSDLTRHPPLHTSHPQPSPEPERPFSERQRGPMVPQKRYKPLTSSDRRRYVDEVNFEPSITFFMQKPDEAGIPLKDAMTGRFARLVSRDERMFQERGPSVSVRVNWPGYQPWSRQIPTRDFRNPPGPITRAKLAKHVAKSVARFIAEHKGRPMEEDSDPAWAVGPDKIDTFDLVLVRLDHVSIGSWQVQLQLIRPQS